MKRKRHAGMFKPGQSGNPAGRPKANYTIRSLARAHTPEALAQLFHIATSRHSSPSASGRAFEAILNIGWGRPRVANQSW